MRFRIGSLALAGVVAFAASARAQGEAKPTADDAPGLKVGEPAPKFTLKDQTGQERTLDELLAKGTVALVFYRSADW